MKSLLHSLSTGPGLPIPWPSLSKLVRVRPGNLVVVLGAPEVGKSMFGLNWAMAIDAPVLCYSLDTDPLTQAERIASNLSGVRKVPLSRIKEILSEYNSPRWYWETTIEEIEEQVQAESEYWGRPPALVIVDNMEDVVMEESAQGYNTAFRALKKIARKHNTTILALHHVHRSTNPNRVIENGDRPIWRGDANYAGEKQAAVMFSLWRPRDDSMRVAIIKNRSGPSNAKARLFCELGVDMGLGQIFEKEEE